jgi:hypothetical protein
VDVGITGDIDVASGLSEVIFDWAGPARRHFMPKKYGTSLLGLGIILMCQEPRLGLKQRVRFTKKDKQLYVDIMLDLDAFKKIDDNKIRKKLVANNISKEVPRILRKYSFPDFAEDHFIADFNSWLVGASS